MRARSDVIDAYRAILIGVVLCFHYSIRWAPPLHATNVYHYDRIYPAAWQLGAYGVEVFFVISGLVITMTLLRSHDALDFAFRRFSRLYPAAVIATIITFLIVQIWGPPEFHRTLKDLFLSFTLLAPVFQAKFIDGAYWSLVVELKFYFYIALSYLLFKKNFWIALIGLALAGLAVSQIYPAFADVVLIASYMPYFLVGMASWFWIFEKRSTPAICLFAAGVATFPLALSNLTLGGHPSAIAMAVVVAAIISLIALLALGAQIPLGPLPYLGRISYSLYLLHQNIGVTVISLLKRYLACPDLVAMLIAAGLSVGLAALMFQFVEKPAQAWLRKRYLHRRPHLLPVNPSAERA